MNILKLSALPKEFPLIKRTAVRLKLKAYLVGGPVRDMLMGRKALDLDIMVEGDTGKLARSASRQLKAKLVSHARFGTFVLARPCFANIDFATARQERYPKPGSLPVVRFSTVKKDLFRRDFTINAMAYGISGPDNGKLIDLYGGTKDLKDKVLRILHKKSFSDDPTRIFRLARFHSRGFKVDPAAQKLAKKHAPLVRHISRERLREELKAVLAEKNAFDALNYLNSLGAFKSLPVQPVVDEKLKAISGAGSLEEKLCLLFPEPMLDKALDYLNFERKIKHRVNELIAGRRGKPAVTGLDLIKLGYKPGENFKKIMDLVKASGIKSRQKAVRFVIDNFPKKS